MSHGEAIGDLIESIYAAALRPAAWRQFMQLLQLHFQTTMEAFYFLNFNTSEVRVVELNGVTPHWLGQFRQLYFTPDNPWARLTRQHHRPGVIRTAETLIRQTRDPGILWRSTYFNEWMRPQHFSHTMGATPFANGGIVANVSLFRPADAPTFGTREIASLRHLGHHLTRGLEIGMRLEQAAQIEALGLHAFDTSCDGLALVDTRGRLHYANPALERVLRRAEGLFLHEGRLQTTTPEGNQRLRMLISRTTDSTRAPGETLRIQTDAEHCFVLRCMPVRAGHLLYHPERALTLILVTSVTTDQLPAAQALQHRYGLTPAQSRLAAALVTGAALREAAQGCGISYETARIYLKQLFSKTNTHRQSELVSLLLRGAAREF